jgi:hypothetical protein
MPMLGPYCFVRVTATRTTLHAVNLTERDRPRAEERIPGGNRPRNEEMRIPPEVTRGSGEPSREPRASPGRLASLWHG